MPGLRLFFTLLHRWVGLAIAGFVFVAGVTGAVISWDHELDDALNTHLMHVDTQGEARASLELAQEIEARDPRVRVTYVPLLPESGKALNFGVSPEVDPSTGRSYEPGYNEVFIDPVTGAENGRRDWGAAWPITRENFISFLYVLHYTLHIPELWGNDHWGLWLMGGMALLWTLDCFVGFYLTLPRRRSARAPGNEEETTARGAPGFWSRWAPAWKIKTSASAWRINFDIHRAFGLWTWGLLFTLAFSAVSMNLYSELFYPVLSKVSTTTPSPFDLRKETGPHEPIRPTLGYPEILEKARAEARRRSWAEPAGGLFYAPRYGIYGVRFFETGQDHGAAGLGPKTLYLDSGDGRLIGDYQPWNGTAADVFVQLQFPLHSGRILGLPGRILVSFMGVVAAALSVTGVVIWWRKRAARQFQNGRLRSGQSGAPWRAPVGSTVPNP